MEGRVSVLPAATPQDRTHHGRAEDPVAAVSVNDVMRCDEWMRTQVPEDRASSPVSWHGC